MKRDSSLQKSYAKINFMSYHHKSSLRLSIANYKTHFKQLFNHVLKIINSQNLIILT